MGFFDAWVRRRLLLVATVLLVACSAPPRLTSAKVTPSPPSAPAGDPVAPPTGTATTAATPTPATTTTTPRPVATRPSPPKAATPAAAPTTTGPRVSPLPRLTPLSTVTPAPPPVRTTPAPPPPPVVPKAAVPNFSKVAVILMENEEYSGIIGNPSAPYINALASGGALATQYYAVSHPSLPNYLALTGGSTFGVTNDCNPSPTCAGGTSVVQEMAAAGMSWRAYMDNLPSPCAQGDAGTYAVRHDPFVYYANVVHGSCGNVVAGTQLHTDIAAGTLARFTWLTPNLCNDMHDCPVSTGDAYLSGVVPQLLGALGPNGVLFLVWDEGTSNLHGGGRVTMVAAGPGARKGYRSSAAYDHYSLLRTIEDAWGLPRLGNSAAATPMTDLF